MIRTKKRNISEVEVLDPPAATQTQSSGERGGDNGSGQSGKPWYERSRYYKNPPEEHKFQPGCAPGPGRPPYKVLSQALWKQLEKVDPKTQEPRYMALIESIIDKAIGKSPGSGTHAQLIFDRIEGLLKQRLEVGAVIITNPLGNFNGDMSKLSDAELALAERLGLMALAKARQLQQQGERNE